LDGRDTTPLRGRRIVIDPGHGGAFRGALGPRGLAEADVNLGVARHLRDLLAAAGAVPLLTRATDRDDLTAADSSLAGDLGRRLARVESLRAEVFVSIHHNSNASRDTTLNALETWYPAGRDGADLDLARAIHRHLARNLEVTPARILPGNFRVLRESRVPAVLGEAAMISHPAMERRLARDDKQALEAQAWFLGLLDYFAGGSPRWTPTHPDTVLADPARPPVLRWRFAPGVGPAAGPGLDPSSLRLTVDGAGLPVELEAVSGLVAWRPTRDWPTGDHRLELRARNLAGRSTPISRTILRVPFTPGELRARLWTFAPDPDRPDTTRPALLAWEWRDRAGQVADPGRALEIAPPATGGEAVPLHPRPDGRGWQFIPPAAAGDAIHYVSNGTGADHQPGGPVERRLLPAAGRIVVLRPAAREWRHDLVPGGAWRARAPLPEWDGIAPVPAWPLVAAARDSLLWIEADGALPIVETAPGLVDGDPAGAAPHDTLVWRPFLPALIGRAILLDPAGGGADNDGAGPSGTRGADLNLGVARALAALLRGAGARVAFTRNDERWIAPEAKLLQANETGAELFLTLRRARPGESDWTAVHHVTSAQGRRWARLLTRTAAPLATPDSITVAAGASYLLRQTACPALEAALPPPRYGRDEERLEDPSHAAATARGLFLAIAALLADDALLATSLDPAALILAHPDLLPPLDTVTWAQLDGNLPWLPPRWCVGADQSLSSCPAPGLPAVGPAHTIEVHTVGGWSLVALHRTPAGWAGRLLRARGATTVRAGTEKTPRANNEIN
jgi:N-acetylmuramoyl-L-alanine amidase